MPAITGDDNMIEEAETDGLSRCGKLSGRPHISIARSWISGGVVVSNRETTPVVPEDAVEDLSDRQRRTVDRAGGDRLEPADMVARVTDQDENALSALSGEFGLGNPKHVLGPSERSSLGPSECCKLTQAESGNDRPGLSVSNSGSLCQLFRLGYRERSKAAMLSQKCRRQVKGALPASAVSEDEGEEFRLRQRVDAAGEQALTGSFVERNIHHQHGHGNLRGTRVRLGCDGDRPTVHALLAVYLCSQVLVGTTQSR